jgi:hypothetical protein
MKWNEYSPTSSDILRRARFFIRRQLFIEMCQTSNAMEALTYLQNDVSNFVDHADALESKEFRELTQFLFKWPGSSSRARISAASGNDIVALGRIEKGRESGLMDVQAGGMASGGLFSLFLNFLSVTLCFTYIF